MGNITRVKKLSDCQISGMHTCTPTFAGKEYSTSKCMDGSSVYSCALEAALLAVDSHSFEGRERRGV